MATAMGAKPVVAVAFLFERKTKVDGLAGPQLLAGLCRIMGWQGKEKKKKGEVGRDWQKKGRRAWF